MNRLLIFLDDWRIRLQGYKTYIVAALGVALSLVQLFFHDSNFDQFLNSPDVILLLNALGLGFLRAGISKIRSK